MATKRYLAASMQQALRQIREELGADAVILSTRKTATGVEVLCAVDAGQAGAVDDGLGAAVEMPRSQVAEIPRSQAAEARQGAGNAREIAAGGPARGQRGTPQPRVEPVFGDCDSGGARPVDDVVRPADLLAQKRDHDLALQAMRDEITQLRTLIRELPGLAVQTPPRAGVAATGPTPAAGPVQAGNHAHSAGHAPTAVQGPLTPDSASRRQAGAAPRRLQGRMTAMGMSRDLIQQLLTAIGGADDEAAWQRILTSLGAGIKVLDNELIDIPGCHVLLGATGAGKTTTVAKLAARYVMKHGPDSLALVTTDRNRLAGAQQLQALGRLLRVPVVVPGLADCLDDVLDRLADKRMVLVDTAGLAPTDAGRAEQTRLLATTRHRLQRCFILPATSQIQVLKASHKACMALGVDHCIISKIDEAASLGEALSLLVTEKLPLAYIADGQQIAADIHRWSARTLLGRLLRLWQDQQGDEHFTGEKAQYGQDLVI